MPFNIGGYIYNQPEAKVQDYQNIITRGLLFHIDASTPESYIGSGTAWSDMSPSGSVGTLVNGPTYSTAGSGSILFDGVDDGMSSNASMTGVQSFTATAWVRTTNTSGYNFAFSAGSYNSPVIAGWGLTIYTSNTIYFDHCNVATVSSYVTSNVYDGNWHQVGIYRDSSNNAGIIYDGAIVTTVSYATSFTNTTFSVGYRPGGAIYAPFFGGNIANALVYNRGLSAAEVAQNYNIQRNRFGI